MYDSSEQPTLPELVGRFDKEIKGSLNVLLVLKIIDKKEHTYGYEIKKTIEKITFSEIKLTDSTLYTLLRSLELKYQVIQSEDDYPLVYYRLTDKGRQILSQLEMYWKSITEIATIALSNLESDNFG